MEHYINCLDCGIKVDIGEDSSSLQHYCSRCHELRNLRVENAKLKEEIKRLRTWQVGLVEMEKERDSAVTRADAAEAALVDCKKLLEERGVK